MESNKAVVNTASQTEEIFRRPIPFPASVNSRNPGINTGRPLPVGAQKRKNMGPYTPVRSKLIAPRGVIRPPKNENKNRRSTPWSNIAYNPPAQVPTPEEFKLDSFTFTVLPNPHGKVNLYNDDLNIECYTPSTRSYMGKQRRGINEPFPEATSYEAHIALALSAPFPLYGETELPLDLINALHFNRDNSVSTIAEFRRFQLDKLRIISEECKVDTQKWYDYAPEDVLSANNNIHIALLAHIMRFARMGGANWIMQFVKGFPITGVLSQKGVFPYEQTLTETPPIRDHRSLFQTKTARFKERASKKPSRYPRQLWEEALLQVERGWLSKPEPLDSSGNFRDSPHAETNITFRFGVLQSDKLRGCDDSKDSCTNQTCQIATPHYPSGMGSYLYSR